MTTTPEGPAEDPTLDLEPAAEPAPEPAPVEDTTPAPADYDTPREQLAAQINQDAAAAGIELTAYPWIMQPEQVGGGKAVAAVYRAELTNPPQAGVLRHELMVDLYVSLTDGEEVEAEADDFLDQVLLSVERLRGLTWTKAERTNFADSYAGYRITCTGHSPDVYASTIRTEHAAAAAESGN